jgi:hypothetical protein
MFKNVVIARVAWRENRYQQQCLIWAISGMLISMSNQPDNFSTSLTMMYDAGVLNSTIFEVFLLL